MLAPVDTGHLRRSIQIEMQGDLTAVVFVAADYGAYVEFGTRRMRAQPYFTPATVAAQQQFNGELRKVI